MSIEFRLLLSALHNNSSSIKKLQSFHRSEIKSSYAHLYRHNLHYHNLYQIKHFPVKENPLIILINTLPGVLIAQHIFFMRTPDREKVLDQLHQQIIADGPRPKHSQNGPIFVICKTSEFFEKSPLSEAGKHPDFQVTSCLQNVSTSVGFAYIESE